MTRENDIPAVVSEQLRDCPPRVEVEILLVPHVFDFPLTRHEMDGQVHFEIGRNDVEVPLVLSESEGELFALDDGRACFVNSSFPQFLAAVTAWNELLETWDNDTPTERRLAELDSRLLPIDPHALRDPEAFWSVIREEIGYGII